MTKSQRITNSSGTIVSTVDLDPWGGDTSRSSNEAFQPHRYTSYERDTNGADDAMNRRYNRWWARFDQPDPYDGSYDAANPQSLNRYTYVNNDPVNFVDPSGLVLDCRTGVDGRITCRDIGGGPGMRLDGGGLFIHGLRETVRSNDSLLDWYLHGRNGSPQFRGGPSFDGSRRGGSGGGGGQLLNPQEIQKRIGEGAAWDTWYQWVNCNTPIMNKFNAQIKDFLKVPGGEAFRWEVGAGIGAATAYFGAGSGQIGGIAGTGTEGDFVDGGPVVGIWAAALIVVGVHMAERQHINNIRAEYQNEVTKNCGSKPPHP